MLSMLNDVALVGSVGWSGTTWAVYAAAALPGGLAELSGVAQGLLSTLAVQQPQQG
jgi:hypothetical protein